MITSKTRAKLRGIASGELAVCQIGKEGLTPMVLDSITKALTKRELIKINVLQNCDEDIKSLMTELCETLDCEPIGMLGRKIIIYKLNPDNKKHVLD